MGNQPAQPSVPTTLNELTDEERELIKHYRAINQTERGFVFGAALKFHYPFLQPEDVLSGLN